MAKPKSFTIIASSAEIKKKWVQQIKENLAVLGKKGRKGSNSSHSALWVPDSEVPDCNYCSKKFDIIRRRHHCRECGQIFCQKCSNHRWRITKISTSKDVRVCISCYEKLSGSQSDQKLKRTESKIKRIQKRDRKSVKGIK